MNLLTDTNISQTSMYEQIEYFFNSFSRLILKTEKHISNIGNVL